MANPKLNSIDEYEAFLTEKMTFWSTQQRIALAAAIAERWLPAYESFSAEEDWGDPDALRQSLDAVWSCVQGRVLTESDIARHTQQIDEITPHMDDFDAEEALIACVALSDALRSCGTPENTIFYVTRVALGVFEGLISEWPVEPGAQARVWRKNVVRKELQVQLNLIEEINSFTSLDAESIKALRARIGAIKIKTPVRAKLKAPAALTNQTLFEQYRRMVESDLKGQAKFQAEPTAHPYLFALSFMGYWMARYSRRLQTINGSYGRVADEQGQCALVARNRARDLAETDRPDWDTKVGETLEMCLKNNSQLKVLDAASVETPHAYGPSLRRLWLEGRRLGQSDLDGWKYVRAWASHRPSAWENEDRRKSKGSAHQVPEFTANLARALSWSLTGDPFHPWATEVDGTIWRVRINDFPDELMYSLIIGNENAGNFHDWPETWNRPSDSAIDT
jgi:uncharacterized protein YjaG (DUF416 family)